MTTSSRVRSRVLGFAFALAVITYLDRICISAAAPFIMDELHITVVQMSLVFGAFTLAYRSSRCRQAGSATSTALAAS